jgi:predicted transcriptional regulator
VKDSRRRSMKKTIRLKRIVPGAAVAVAALLLCAAAGPVQASDRNERVIIEAFEDILDREPSSRELDRYLDRMEDDGWTERDVREDLRERRHEGDRDEDPDAIVRRAYEDVLHREPDEKGLRLYRGRIIDDGWTERDVRKALRESPEHDMREAEDADKLIRRAYEDVLGREPDAKGLASYREKVLDQGWDERDVRKALRESPEYRKTSQMTRPKAQEIVRKAYEDVLGREPDASSAGYVDRVLKDHWTQADVEAELRKSDEYRSRQ